MTSSTPTDEQTLAEMTVRPVAPGWLILLVAALALGAGVGTARFARLLGVTSVEGQLQAKQVTVRSPVDGHVDAMNVALGDQVRPGDVLATIKEETAQPIEELEAQLATAKRRKESALAQCEYEASKMTAAIEEHIHTTEMQIAELRGKLYSAEMERLAYRDALDGSLVQPVGHVSSILDQSRVVGVFPEEHAPEVGLTNLDRFHSLINHEQAAAKAEACEKQIALCDQRIAVLTDRRDKIADQLRKTAGLDELEAIEKRLVDRIARVDEPREIISNAHGTVVHVTDPGESCDQQTPVIAIADTAQRHVTAKLPVSVASELSLGDVVPLEFPTGRGYSGTLRFIAPASDSSSGVAVSIEQTGKRWPRLSLGCPVTVHVR